MVTDVSHKARRISFSEANALIIDLAIRKAEKAGQMRSTKGVLSAKGSLSAQRAELNCTLHCVVPGCHGKRMNGKSDLCPTHALREKDGAKAPAGCWSCPKCGFYAPRNILEKWSISKCPGCGHRTEVDTQHEVNRKELTDDKLLAKVRALIRQEHAGFVPSGYGEIKNACIEPGCSCSFDTCGPFRDPAVRCTAFEQRVLPRDPELEQAYWAHISQGTVLHIRRCTRPGCGREVASVGPNARYCSIHASLQAREKARKRARRYRASHRRPDVTVLPSAVLDKQGSQKASSRSKGETMDQSSELSETLVK